MSYEVTRSMNHSSIRDHKWWSKGDRITCTKNQLIFIVECPYRWVLTINDKDVSLMTENEIKLYLMLLPD